jgi:hypothetical protein
MPARLITIYTAVVAFLGFKVLQPEPDIDELLTNSINKSYDSWVAKGYIPQEPTASQK